MSAPATTRRPVSRSRKPSPKATAHKWSRNLHSWASMVSMLLVLFFAVTGLTASHPAWVGAPRADTVKGALPATANVNGTWDLLVVSEFVRNANGVTGSITDHGIDGNQGRLAYQGPGYEASVFFDTGSGTYTLTTTSYGLVGVMNDLHKGRHTNIAWNVVIDIAAIVLTLVAVTGLVLQLLIERRRTTALILLGAGVIIGVTLLTLSWH